MQYLKYLLQSLIHNINILYSDKRIRIFVLNLKETNMDFTKVKDLQLLRTLLILYCYHIVCFWIAFWHSLFGHICGVLFQNGFKIFVSTTFIKWFISWILFGIFILSVILFTYFGVIFYSRETCCILLKYYMWYCIHIFGGYSIHILWCKVLLKS